MSASIARRSRRCKPRHDREFMVQNRNHKAAVHPEGGSSRGRRGHDFKGLNTMKTLLVTLALGAAMISTQALAQDGVGERGGHAMQDMTRAHAQQRADMMFQRFDLNHDGSVTRQEAEQAASQFGAGGRAEKMIDRVFGAAQSLTLQQFEAVSLTRFDRDDLNHDGTVTVAERQQVRAQLKAQRAAAENPGK